MCIYRDQGISERYAKITELNAMALKNLEATDEILKNVNLLLSQSNFNLQQNYTGKYIYGRSCR